MFGQEAGLFSPTGSLANQLAIRTLVKPGEELLVETRSHIVRAELGAAATFSGITTRTWPSVDGLLKAEDPLAIAHENAGPYLVSTKAIAVENTHNFGGGTVQPIEEIAKLSTAARARGIAMHLDGARIWNAHQRDLARPLVQSCFQRRNVLAKRASGASVTALECDK
jgi:threonine aldolase